MSGESNVTRIDDYAPSRRNVEKQHFCMTRNHRGMNARWEFWVRFEDERGVTHEEHHSAETAVELDSRRVDVVSRLRGRNLIPCNCGCADRTTLPNLDPPT